MPYIIQGRGGRIVAAVAATLALTATPALATSSAPVISAAPGCDTPTTQAFLFAGDKSDFVLAPGGDVEGSLAGWNLTGGAQAVAGRARVAEGCWIAERL